MCIANRKYLLPLISVVLLSACATVVKPHNAGYPIGDRLMQSQRAIASAKAQVDRDNPTFSAIKGETPLGTNTHPTTVFWNGDARDLLATLAKRNGMTFQFGGLIGPLPVTIDVKNKPLNQVLGAINQQVTHRGTVTLAQPNSLTLQYLPTTDIEHAGKQP